jgi:phage baseplate assembly protein W
MPTTLTNRYKDIDLSFQKNPKTKDIYTLTDVDAVKRSVKLLVMTNFSERLFHPEIGSGVYGSLFENITPETATILQINIENCINNFEPRARVIDVIVKDFPDQNGIEIEISFYVVNIEQPVSVRVQLERIR